MFESNLAANDAAYGVAADSIRDGADRFCDDFFADMFRAGGELSQRRRSITRFQDDSARIFHPFRVY